MNGPDYAEVCRYAGQLFLETRHQLEDLAGKLKKAEKERDEAVRLAFSKENGPQPQGTVG